MTETRGQATRNRIIDSGLELLWREGAENLSLRQIASAAGITPMAVYRHFDDKQSLELALLERAFVLFEDYMRQRPEAGTARDDLLALASRFFDFALERESHFGFLFLSDARPVSSGRKSPVRQISRPTFLLLRESVAACSREASLSADDINGLTTDVLAFCVGQVALLISGNFYYPKKHRKQKLMQAFERYIHAIQLC